MDVINVAKERDKMGWTKDAPRCRNCKHFKSEILLDDDGSGKNVRVEEAKHCGIGGFATPVNCWCNSYERKNFN